MAWLYSAWRFVVNSRIVQGAIFVAGLIGYHLFAKWQAGREAVSKERAKAREKALEQRAEHEGDVHAARQRLEAEQQERRERESSEDPRDRFGRDPWD